MTNPSKAQDIPFIYNVILSSKKVVRWQMSFAAKVRENNNDLKEEKCPPIEDIL